MESISILWKKFEDPRPGLSKTKETYIGIKEKGTAFYMVSIQLAAAHLG